MLTICYLGSQPRLMFVSFFQKIYVAYSPILFQNNSLHSYVRTTVRTYVPAVRSNLGSRPKHSFALSSVASQPRLQMPRPPKATVPTASVGPQLSRPHRHHGRRAKDWYELLSIEMSELLRKDREKLLPRDDSTGFKADGYVEIDRLAEAMDDCTVDQIKAVCDRSIREKSGTSRFEIAVDEHGTTFVRALDRDGKCYAKNVGQMVWEKYMRDLPRATPPPRHSALECTGPALPDKVQPINGMAVLEENLEEEKESRSQLDDAYVEYVHSQRMKAVRENEQLRSENARLQAEVQDLTGQMGSVLEGVRFVAETAARMGLSPRSSASMARTWYAQAQGT